MQKQWERAIRYGHIWLPGYLRSRWHARYRPAVRRVWLLFADHFEPRRAGADETLARARVESWAGGWPSIAQRHHDALGRPAQYTFFYPEEEYSPELLDPLAKMAHQGIADVEVHLHHDGEGEQNFIDRISTFTETLYRRHALLRIEQGRITFGFIHGNWSLDNSGPEGRFCGLNNELILLKNLGCYADFTYPSSPHPGQPRIVNSIYWATDDPKRPKSHDSGVPVRPGGSQAGDLLMVQGPLGLSFHGGRIIPRIEIGELAGHNPVTRERVRQWLDVSPAIGGDMFIKLFAHGAWEPNTKSLLERDLDLTLVYLREECSERSLALHFVSAWQMRQVIEAVRLNRDPVQALVGNSRPEPAGFHRKRVD